MSKAVLITRPVGQADALIASLTQYQVPYYHIPAVNILPRLLTEQDIAYIQAAEILIFTSQNAAMYAPLFTQAATVLAVGQATRHALFTKGYASIICPSDFSSEGLLALSILQSVRGKRIAILKGVNGREELQTVLMQRGACCQGFAVYARAYPADGASRLQELLAEKKIGCVVVTSGEILQNLCRMAGPYQDSLQCLPLIVISQRIARLAQDLGFASVEVIDHDYLRLGIFEHQQRIENITTPQNET